MAHISNLVDKENLTLASYKGTLPLEPPGPIYRPNLT